MARNNPKVSPEVAVELVDLARQMRRLVYGGDGAGLPRCQFFAFRRARIFAVEA